jgi:hypothetical protein
MPLTIKEEVLQLVTAIEDEETLQVIKNNIVAIKRYDVTDDLSAEDFNELKNMVNEPFGYETLTKDEFDDSIKKWRSTK